MLFLILITIPYIISIQYMGYPRTMGAGLAGSTTKIYGNANVNQIQYGDKLQGLPPVTGRRR